MYSGAVPMDDYDYSEFPGAETWADRYPSDAVGHQELLGLPVSDEGNREAWRRLTQLRPTNVNVPKVSRLFVSHRKCDRDYAMRAAWLATQQGFRFWLDVLNPVLRSLPHQNLSPQQQALVTAIVIEMGLLNSSHVLALVTPNTPGSLWVPYEYGRVKANGLYSIQAGCWNHKDTLPQGKAEYLELGANTFNEGDINKWLDSEYTAAMSFGPTPRPWPYKTVPTILLS
jgi:hypothetical protein